MPIKLDPSHTGVVVYCTDCQHWAESAADRLEGSIMANQHERQVHPEQTLWSSNLSQLRTRHAAKARTISEM